MKGSGRIISYAVNRKTISLRIEMSGTAPIIDELELYKGKQKTIRLDAFQVVGKIESITISRNVGFLVHTARLDFIHHRLFRLMEKESLAIEVSTTHQDKLLYFLATIASSATGRQRTFCSNYPLSAKGMETGRNERSRGRGLCLISQRPSRTSSSIKSVGSRLLNKADHVRDGEDNSRDSQEKDRSPEKLVLSLDDLCPLWIRYNTSFKPESVVKEPTEPVASCAATVIPTTVPVSEETGIQGDRPGNGRAQVMVQAFYSEVIEPHREMLTGMLEG